MPEIEQELFNRESDRERERKNRMENKKNWLLKNAPTLNSSSHSVPHQEAIFLFFPRKSDIWNSFNAKVELVRKRVYNWTSCILLITVSILNSPTSTSRILRSCPLHFSVYKQKEFHKANKHLLPSAKM